MTKDNSITTFLKKHVPEMLEIQEIPGDASLRKYERIFTKEENFIFMDSSKEINSLLKFVKITKILEEINLNPPTIFAQDLENGFLLLEDLGDNKFGTLLEQLPQNSHSDLIEEECKLYKKAIDVLLHICSEEPELSNVENYSSNILTSEASLFIDWYLPLYEDNIDINTATKLHNRFIEIISTLTLRLKLPNNILVLRDYHAENLLLTSSNNTLKEVGLIDYQDALIGNPTYDLMSLLEDARRDVPEEVQSKMITYFIENFASENTPEDIMHDYYILAAIRNLKILGIFCRLKVRDNKNNYLKYLPRVKSYLKNDLKHPALNELKLFLEKNFSTL